MSSKVLSTTAAELERRLFEVLGGWAPEAPEPEAKLLFRVHSFQHARHAEALAGWEETAPLAPVAGLLDDVAGGPSDTPTRLAGVYRVILPALAAVYRDGAPQILAEDEAAMQEGERLLAKLSGDIAHAEGAEAP